MTTIHRGADGASSDDGLRGTTAFVTGASSGIGTAVATALAARGVRVALGGRNRAKLDALAAALPGDPVVLSADLSDGHASLAVAHEAIDALGRVDALVNNAGLDNPRDGSALTPETVDRILAVNVRAPLLISSVLAPHMAEHGGGAVVGVASVLGHVGARNAALYSATKGAVSSGSRSLAAEWGDRGVRFNVVSPGIVETPMGSFVTGSDEARARYESQTPLQRVAQVEDVADVVTFLVSPASRYVTAEDIVVDGGWSLTRVGRR